VFIEPYLFTQGGPANATLTVMLLIYDYAFGNSLGGDYGKAAALSLMLVAFLAVFLARLSASHACLEHPLIAFPLRRRQRRDEGGQQALVLDSDWRRPSVRWGLGTAHTVLLVLLVIIGLGPILWLVKSAITPTQDTLAAPLSLFPHGIAWSNLTDAWNQVDVGLYLWNTIVLAFGSLVAQIVIATTGAYALSVLRPKYGNVIMARC